MKKSLYLFSFLRALYNIIFSLNYRQTQAKNTFITVVETAQKAWPISETTSVVN